MKLVLKNRIYEIHINDNDGSEDQHKLVEYGNVPIKYILNDFNSIRSCPTIEDINSDGLPDLIRGNASGGVELFIGNEFI